LHGEAAAAPAVNVAATHESAEKATKWFESCPINEFDQVNI